MSESMFIEAVSLARSGRKAEARKLLEQVLKADKTNEMAWLWYAECVDTPEDRRRALQACVRINPQAQRVRLSLTALERTGTLANDNGLTRPVYVGNDKEENPARANRNLTEKDQWVLSGAANVFTVSPDHISAEEFERIEKRTEAFLLKNPDLKPVWSAEKISLPEPVEAYPAASAEPSPFIETAQPMVMPFTAEAAPAKPRGQVFALLLVTLMIVLLVGTAIVLQVV